MLTSLQTFRSKSRLPAVLALLALCLQLVSMGIGQAHAAERLSKGGGLIQICTPAGIINVAADGTEYPAVQTGGQHCPFCASTSSAPPLLVVALSFFLPDTASADFNAPSRSVLLPTAPDQRHAPSRAPPLFA